MATFIIIHVGSRFAGESLAIAATGSPDPWQPFASAVIGLWAGMSPQALVVGEHVAFWLAIGLIMLFIPYFPYTKHVHLFFAPLNFLLKPERRSIGELGYINLDDTSIEQFGAAKLNELGWEQLRHPTSQGGGRHREGHGPRRLLRDQRRRGNTGEHPLERVFVGELAVLDGAIVCRNSMIGRASRLDEGVIVGERSHIRRRTPRRLAPEREGLAAEGRRGRQRLTMSLISGSKWAGRSSTTARSWRYSERRDHP